MKTFYNDIEPFIVGWLKRLESSDCITPGTISGTSILDLSPADIVGFDWCHFFAGLAGWNRALQLVGWPKSFPVWTGSCPCQPFSIANTSGGGQDDLRHLWPAFYKLIKQGRPPVLFGEQVENAIKWGWLDELFDDLEKEDYSCGAIVLPASSIGVNHRRTRIFWGAYSLRERRERFESLKRILKSTETSQSLNGDTVARARRAVVGDYIDLLSSNELSLAMERRALTGYGNSIVPELAAEFIRYFINQI